MPVSPQQSENSLRLQLIDKYIRDRIDENLLNGRSTYIVIKLSECPVEFTIFDMTDEIEEKIRTLYKQAGWRNLRFDTRSLHDFKSFTVHLSK